MSRVLVIGHACIDVITRLPRPVGQDEKLEAEEAWMGGGGPGANAAVALRRLGHDVRLAVALGDDALGELARRELQDEGIELMVGARSGSTALAQIQVVGRERSVAWKTGSAAPLTADGVETWLDDVDLLYVDGHQLPAAHEAVRRAAARDVPVIADLGTLRAGMEDWLAHLAWAVASPRFAAAWAKTDATDAGLDALATAAPGAIGVGITLGAKGGVARIQGQDVRWGPRKVRVQDTTAAGDAFHAGLADAFLRDMTPEQSLQWASAVGASVCRGLGGRRWLPRDRARMQDFERAWPERASN